MLWFLTFWLALSFVAGLVANMRGRDGIGWFALAIVISPFVAGLLAFVLPRKELPFGENESPPVQQGVDSVSSLSTFKPDGVYAGVTYMVTPDSAILAITPSGLVRFQNIEEFLAATYNNRIAS